MKVEETGISEEKKFPILIFTIVAYILIAFYAGFVAQAVSIYTHLFYIPIILAGIWYHKKAVYVALIFGIVHILVTYFSYNPLSLSVFGRSAIFLVVAYAIGYLSEEEAKKASALRESEGRLSQIVHGSSIPTFVIDSEHTVTHWNKACENLTGLSADAMVGSKKHWTAFYFRERPVMADFMVDRQPEHEITNYYGDKYRRSTLIEGAYEALDFFPALGEEGKWLLFTAAPLRDPKGEIIGAIETLQDITETKQAEAEVQKSEEKYRTFFETSRDFVFITSKDGRLIDANDAGAALFGYESIAEFQKVNITELYENPEDRERFILLMEQQGFVIEFPVNFRKRDGSIFNALMTSSVKKDEEGIVIGFQGTVKDISERKEAEKRQLQLIKELELTNKDLSDFLRAAAHDLKTPLRGVASLAEWLRTDYADRLDTEGKKLLDLLRSRVTRMYGLLDGIQHYSRIGRVEEEKEEVDLNTIVSEVIDMIDPPENIDIEVIDQLSTVVYEVKRMEEVFQNLLSNAIRHMGKPEGKITIGCTEEAGYWKFSVADNGPGIDEKYHDKIFQMFQTLKPRDEVESIGVGLTVVKKIVEAHGGKVWVNSKGGEGSTFFFTVPKTPEGALI